MLINMSADESGDKNEKKRPRQANFSASELSIIADEVKLKSGILFGCFSSTISNQSKMKEWDVIASKLNANSNSMRTGQQIRKKWNDYRSQVKRKAIDFRKESRKTGGGCPPESLSDVEHKVVALIPSCQIEGISGGLDTEEMNIEEVQTNSTLESEQVSDLSTMTATLPDSSATVASTPQTINTSAISLTTVNKPAATVTSDERVVTSAAKPQPRRKQQALSQAVQTQPSHVSAILEIEVVKRDTLREILNIQREMLQLRREEVAISRERLALERHIWEAQSIDRDILSLTPTIKM